MPQSITVNLDYREVTFVIDPVLVFPELSPFADLQPLMPEAKGLSWMNEGALKRSVEEQIVGDFAFDARDLSHGFISHLLPVT